MNKTRKNLETARTEAVPFSVRDLGLLRYGEALSVQERVHAEVLAGTEPPTLLLVEHPPVLTLGASFREENLRLAREEYAERGIEVFRVGRGGDVTYHGPGQLVAYPIFRVDRLGKDLHRYLRQIEECVLATLAALGLEGRRFPPHTGVWTEDRKVCAIGIQVRKWVSTHGLALNCNVDLDPFDLIVPCGIQGYGVTSISRELGREVSVEEVQPLLVHAFAGEFGAPIL